MTKILPFNQKAGLKVKAKVLGHFEEIIDSGNFVLGKYTEKLQGFLANSYGGLKAITMSSGTVALECLFEFLYEYREVRTVAVPSNTNFATVSSIIRSGAKPIFIDCDKDGQLLLSSLTDVSNSRDIDAVIIVHIGGYVSKKIEEIVNLCSENNWIFLEDCAHAHGSQYKSKPLGTFGLASILSFFPTKLVNGAEGGALLTSDDELASFALKWRNQGKSGTFGNHHEVLGGSYRMSEFNCAFAIINYEALEIEIDQRMSLAKSIISQTENITPATFFHMNRFSCYKLISSHPKYSGEEVENKLKQQGIICGGAVYRGACHVQPVFNKVAIDTSLISTDQFSNKHFCLPVHSGISLESAEKIISAVTNL